MGYDAKNIQRALMMCGYNTGGIDGAIGPQTKKAIKEFQGDNGVDQDGIFGPITAEALVPALGEASSEAVTLQGHFSGGEDAEDDL